MSEPQRAVTDQDIANCFEVMAELRLRCRGRRLPDLDQPPPGFWAVVG